MYCIYEIYIWVFSISFNSYLSISNKNKKYKIFEDYLYIVMEFLHATQ